MKKVLCSHRMNTTNFICKDPDAKTGGRFFVPVIAKRDVWVDERIVEAYPTTFIPVEGVPVAEDEEIKDSPDDASDEADAVDPEQLEQAFDKFGEQRTFDPLGSTLDEQVTDLVEDVKEDAENEGESFVPVEGVDFEDVEDVEADNAKETADEVDAEILDDVIAEAEGKSEDDEKAELLNTIDAFKSRKKLDVFAATLKVELDGRKKLPDMKTALKEALELI